MSSHGALAPGSCRVVPECPKSQADTVGLLHLEWVAEGVQYWSCDSCGLVWGTRAGDDLRSLAADRTPKRPV